MGAAQQALLTGAERQPFSSGLLDVVTAATLGACALRRLTSAYTGPLVRVRREGDDVEQDIGYDTYGDLDLAALASFIGGDNARPVKFYNQDSGGSSLDLVQATEADQPYLVSGGVLKVISGSKPGMQFSVGQRLTHNTSRVQPLTRCMALKFDTVSSGDVFSDAAQNSLYFSASGSLSIYAGSASPVIKSGISAGNTAVVIEAQDGSSTVGRYNDSESTVNPGTLGFTRASIGANYLGGSAAGVYVSECIIFTSALSSGDRAAVSASMRSYWGI